MCTCWWAPSCRNAPAPGHAPALTLTAPACGNNVATCNDVTGYVTTCDPDPANGAFDTPGATDTLCTLSCNAGYYSTAPTNDGATCTGSPWPVLFCASVPCLFDLPGAHVAGPCLGVQQACDGFLRSYDCRALAWCALPHSVLRLLDCGHDPCELHCVHC